MKKLLLPLLILLACFQAKAQFRFYAGMEAGPKLSFSNSITDNKSSTTIRGGWQAGIIGGFNFPDSRITLETGFSMNTHRLVIDYENDFNETTGGPELWYTIENKQIPLLLKVSLLQKDSKFKVQTVTGFAFSRYSGGLMRSSFEYFKTSKGAYYSFAYQDDQERMFGFKPIGFFLDGYAKTLMIQTGFEIAYELGKSIQLRSGIIYQTSLKPMETRSFEYTYHYENGVIYEPLQQVSVISRGEALNLNFGLTYAFGKRHIASE